LVTAATLHDIGYGHAVSGFHALDGASYLAGAGFSAAVCHLVVHHSASTLEAEERGLGLALYDAFAVDEVCQPHTR
jgi:predicted hydrolase (HD superfamily)